MLLQASKAGQLGGGFSVSKVSPAKLGWEKWGGGGWLEGVGRALWGETIPGRDKLEVVFFLKVAVRRDGEIAPRYRAEIAMMVRPHEILESSRWTRTCTMTKAVSCPGGSKCSSSRKPSYLLTRASTGSPRCGLGKRERALLTSSSSPRAVVPRLAQESIVKAADLRKL